MKNRSRAAWLGGLLLVLVGGSEPRAQSRWLTGYLQTVPLWTGSTQLTKSDVSNFDRFRLTSETVFDSVSLTIAYEHAVTFRRRATFRGSGIGTVPSGGEWSNLQWTITEEEHVLWQHRFDRLQIGWNPTSAVELSAGRQAVSWSTTLVFTPADPFSPFNPSDPFREFRAGVDAARLLIYPTPLSEIDIVVRPSKTDVGEELTAVARWLGTWNNWELSSWTGSLYGDGTWAFGTAGALGAWAIRGEAVVRGTDDAVVFRGTFGVDRLLQVGGRDLMLVFEYQRDGFGATTPDEYLDVVFSDPAKRGELQVLGRDETVLQVSYRLHPLWSVAGLGLWNLNDCSALISPSFTYSVSDESSFVGGMFFGVGDDESTLARPLPSEYGVAGTTAYLSLNWFF